MKCKFPREEFVKLFSVQVAGVLHVSHYQNLFNPSSLQLENLQSLNISHNNIKALGALVITPLNSLHELDLTHNPTTCDCDIKWLKFLQVS